MTTTASKAHLALSVDPNDPTAGLVDGSHKDCLPTDTVHVNACSCFQVIEMDVTKLGDEVDHIMFSAHLRIITIII